MNYKKSRAQTFAPLIFSLISVFLFVSTCSPRRFSHDFRVRVTWVVDGDTFAIGRNQFVRLKGIDTPEIAHERGEHTQYFAKRAKKRLIHLIYKKDVIIKRYGLKKDRYGRYLAYVYLPDGRFVNLIMIKEGYAFYYPHKDLERDMAALFLRAQRLAMDQRRGFWAKILTMPAAHRFYIGNRRDRRFHTLSCPLGRQISRRNRIRFSSLYEAFYKGYAPCRKCTPWPIDAR